MPAERSLLFFDGKRNEPPELLLAFARAQDLDVVPIESLGEALERTNRSFPAGLVLDARGDTDVVLETCARMKADPFTSIIPVAVLVADDPPEMPTLGLEAGADEVLHESTSDREKFLRLDLLLRRAARDVSVHPTTHLPGTNQIERELARRLERGAPFAFCYADLDHFKEFNDRYGYKRGDRVILLLSMILRDLVRTLAPDGFVGHIGGDDFVFALSLDSLEKTCDEVLALFDELIPYQYTDDDREKGYFLGKDRRGNFHQIPLMTLSIGIVTNRNTEFDHTAQVSECAGEMKTYAKTLPGSLYVVDRRTRDRPNSNVIDDGLRDSDPVRARA